MSAGTSTGNNPGWHIRQAVAIVRQGGLIAYPTEGVYGLGCDPLNPEAVQRLLTLKNRPLHKGLILIAAEPGQLQPYLGTVSPRCWQRILRSWPGPVTWLLPAGEHTPDWLCGAHTTLAVRVTAHPLAAALCRRLGGPLVSTSANLSGHPMARNPLQVRRQFPRGIDTILTGRVGPETKPSEIRDARSGRIVRAA